jgi:hypothetical protein
MTTAAVERVPVTFFKLAAAGVDEMLAHKMRLEGHVAASYVRACRFLAAIGFTLGKPEPFGSQKALFRKFVMTRG